MPVGEAPLATVPSIDTNDSDNARSVPTAPNVTSATLVSKTAENSPPVGAALTQATAAASAPASGTTAARTEETATLIKTPHPTAIRHNPRARAHSAVLLVTHIPTLLPPVSQTLPY